MTGNCTSEVLIHICFYAMHMSWISLFEVVVELVVFRKSYQKEGLALIQNLNEIYWYTCIMVPNIHSMLFSHGHLVLCNKGHNLTRLLCYKFGITLPTFGATSDYLYQENVANLEGVRIKVVTISFIVFSYIRWI